jgi:hypothetical protein
VSAVALVVGGIRVEIELDAGARALIAEAVAKAKLAKERERRRAVAAFIRANPGASANAVHRALGGNRQETLRAVRDVRNGSETGSHVSSAASRFPASKNQRSVLRSAR